MGGNFQIFFLLLLLLSRTTISNVIMHGSSHKIHLIAGKIQTNTRVSSWFSLFCYEVLKFSVNREQ